MRGTKRTTLDQFNLDTYWGRYQARRAGFDVPKRPTGKPKGDILVRFWSKIDKSPGQGPDGDCWGWLGATHEFGYGVLGRGGRSEGLWKAHRLSWTIANGRIPDEMKVLHHCDNPPCCNPEHLFLGTDLDNARDCIAKGRNVIPHSALGESHHSAKLTVKRVRWARRAYRQGRGQGQHSAAAIARRLGVDRSVIKAIVGNGKRQTWKHVL